MRHSSSSLRLLSCLCFTLAVHFVFSQSRPNSLYFNQRYPNKNEADVCSQIRDVIQRNSGRYRKILIRNTDNLAVYVNDDCRRMTSRAKSKLDVLASRVISTWGSNVRVKVLQAWTDQVNPNDRTSLHYEGRSVRLQLSDNDRNKLGRLAGLAIEAGFDWVHYANQNFIRASVIPDVCQTSVDLVFLLDGSGSVRKQNFVKVKEFVKKVVDFFNIGRDGSHIAVVTFSNSATLNFNLVQHFTKTDMRKAVDGIGFPSGGTRTGEALDYVRNYVLTVNAGMRTDPGIPKVLVLLTDGQSNGKSVLPPAETLRKQGVSIFSVGVGNGVVVRELNEIASDPDSKYVFLLTNFNDLARWVDRLSSVSCSEGSVINSCDNSVTSVESGSFKYFKTEFRQVTNNQVSVEVRDIKGISHLYASATSKNPGPLDSNSVKNENNLSPRAVSVFMNGGKTVYVGVQGQQNANQFSLSFWDNLFSKSKFTASVKENQPAQRIITLQLATRYSLVYTITDGNQLGAFRITGNPPQIYTTKALDREAISQFNLVVVAVNTANKCHKSRTLIEVNVADDNDNAPKFTENPYTATVHENTPRGTLVKTVKATDKDTGVNGQVRYKITSGNTGNVFRLDESDGRVLVVGLVNYESTKNYELHIRAEDGGKPTRYDDTVLRIQVLDVNEGPTIKCDGSCSMKVSESAPIGQKVGKVIGTDPDGFRCSLRYDIASSTAKKSFSVLPNGDIKTTSQLDREVSPFYNFGVTVHDCGSPPLSDRVEVSIAVQDVNDNNPIFPGPYVVNVLESENVGSSILQVKAQDKDEGKNGEVRYTLSQGAGGVFAIDSVTGMITTKVKLDYESKTKYSFTVTATDQGPGARTGTAAVTVNVVDVNDNTPVFQNAPYVASVAEDASTGQLVKTILATDRDSGLAGQVRYSIVSGNQDKKFKVNVDNGRITVNGPLDRETRESYKLTVQATDRGSPSKNSRTTVSITITDINDNSPVFQGRPYTESVSENFPLNDLILKVLATDKDSGQFGTVTYSIVSPTVAKSVFSIGTSNGEIVLKQKLDYETTKSYTFKVQARDGGGRTAQADVKIFVEDYNDNSPVFVNAPYTSSVAENVNIGKIVDTVKATDEDSGPRGSVTYSITAGNVGNAFTISASGVVTVSSGLDRETTESYTLTIKATDDGSPTLSATTTMTVTVTDINDNKPRFGKSSYSFTIAENNNVDAEVGRLGPATDKDKGVNAEIDYTIVSGNSGGTFAFKPTGELVAKVVLDRETTASYDLVIEAKDRGTPPLSTRVPVHVEIADENDNTPIFAKDPYHCKILENSAGNTPVCFVQASDADIDENGKVIYEITTASNEFSINKASGEIRAKVTLDREQTASYLLTIRAKDGGNPSKNSTVKVNVAVVDKNDNEPLFNQTKYEFDVLEDASTSTIIGRVLATDKDEGVNKQVVYSIIGGNINNAFEVDQSSGTIKVKSGLDRETLARYSLTVRARDRGKPYLQSSRSVIVTVKDVNDNKPVFTQNPYTGKIKEDVSVGTPVVQVKANDADEGRNAEIKYSITGGQDRDHFKIEIETGLIRTAVGLDYETIQSYDIVVTATDQGQPPLSSTANVKITVTNTNDNVPSFVPGSPTVSIFEDVAIGTKLVKFNATDKDGGQLTFSITFGNTDNALEIEATSGLLKTGKRLDRETVPRYDLKIRVTDDDGKFSSANLTVIVLDVNDNAPVFDPWQYSVNVTENVKAGPIVSVKATDRDEGVNAKISFSLDATSSQKFTIDSDSGEISTKNPLDHENGARYVIQVTAKDGGVPLLSSVAQVFVTVLDTNDNKPFFKNDYPITLRENTAKGKTVVRVEATDIDSGNNREIEYSITSGNGAGFFTLGASNGILQVAKPVDRETHPSFTLTVLASNKVPYIGSPPSAKTSATVTITIEDVNDNAPVITNTVYIVDVPEDAKSARLVVDVDATDNDVGVNSEIEYTITSGNVQNVFAMDTNTGIVSVKGSLDRETLPLYTLKIRASDKGTPSLYSEKDFTVNITDVDDNPPTFGAKSYDASVNEDVKQFTPVIKIQATDKDTGVNSNLTYSILSGNTKLHFRVDSDTGEVSTNGFLDYEKIKEYTLVVTAKDTKHTAQVSLSIRVVNINDNNPVFKPDRYSKNVAENVGQNVLITTLKATDQDPFGGLTYIIVSGNNENKFSLDPSSGELRTAASLDRETTDFYNVSVRVTDGGVPALSDHGVVEIMVKDINDNAPKFNTTSIQGKVKENSKVGVKVLTVQATDRDIGQNAELRYSITKGNIGNVFKLNADTGLLSVNGNIDRETTSRFSLEVTAQDKGLPSLTSAPFAVYVEVLDENDNDPLFAGNYHRSVTENLSPGTFVEEVEATDQDIGLNAEIVYSIKSGSLGDFTIDGNTGIIETTVALDREDVSSYVIVIEAKDRGTPSRQSTTTVNINVLDANDNKPSFNVSSLVAYVVEEKPKGLFVVKVMATDIDQGDSAEIEYEIIGRGLVKIDSVTGVVTTLVSFDYEQQQRHVFRVSASDKGKPPLSVTADLVVNVVDIDDNCPEFFPKVYNATVQENIPYTQPILTVTATDKDSGQHKDLNYGIRSGNIGGAFNIHSRTGVLTPGSTNSVDRETSSLYHVVVRAGSDYCGVNVTEGGDEEGGGPLSKSVADVYITVTDVNDNVPEFLQKFYSHVFSDIYTSNLGWVNATDSDEGRNAEVTFRFEDVKRVGSTRNLTIVASDNGSPSLSSNTTLTVSMDKDVTCEAMAFDVSLLGHVTVKTLCIFTQVELIGHALVGETIKLNCTAVGNTVPEYRWTRDGVPFTDWSRTGEYVITPLAKDDAGDYLCIASSDAGTILSTSLSLDVKEPPSIIVHPEDTWGELDRETVLHCLAKGDEPMEYSWYKDGVLMSSTGDLVTDRADLVFLETIPEDAGEYFCKAVNNVAQAKSTTAHLRVYAADSVVKMIATVDKPRHPEACQHFNLTKVEEQLEAALSSEVFIVNFPKPNSTCNLNECFNSPCENQGVCQPHGDTDFTCNCPPGWRGEHCQLDENECESESCDNGNNNSTCVNQLGSFSCNCAGNTFGKRCQFVKSTCEPNPCASGEKCYPKETVQKYECLSNVVTVSMTFKLDKLRTPWQDWMKYDGAKEIENIVKNRKNVVAQKGGKAKRRRRDVVGPDYSACSVRVVNAQPKGTEVELEVVLVCSSSPSKDYVCEAMLAEGKVSSCTGDNGVIEEKEPTEAPVIELVGVTVDFIVVDSNGEERGAVEAIASLKETDVESEMEQAGITELQFKANEPDTAAKGGSDKFSSGTAVGIGVAIVVLVAIVAIVIALIVRSRRQSGKPFSIGGRAILSRTQSTDNIVEHQVSMKELKSSETRGVNNKTFSQIYEENDGLPRDLEDGSFMVENQVSRKPNKEYMKELDSADWFHGSLTRSQAEEALDDNEGSFLVRAGVNEGEFYVSARAAGQGPKFRHIAVHRRGDLFNVVCGEGLESRTFATFKELISYMKSHATSFGDDGPTLALKEPMERK